MSTGISLSVCVLTEIDWPVLQVVMTILKNANTKVFPLFCRELRLGQRNEAEPAGEDKPMQKCFFPLMWELGIVEEWLCFYVLLVGGSLFDGSFVCSRLLCYVFQCLILGEEWISFVI